MVDVTLQTIEIGISVRNESIDLGKAVDGGERTIDLNVTDDLTTGGRTKGRKIYNGGNDYQCRWWANAGSSKTRVNESMYHDMIYNKDTLYVSENLEI